MEESCGSKGGVKAGGITANAVWPEKNFSFLSLGLSFLSLLGYSPFPLLGWLLLLYTGGEMRRANGLDMGRGDGRPG